MSNLVWRVDMPSQPGWLSFATLIDQPCNPYLEFAIYTSYCLIFIPLITLFLLHPIPFLIIYVPQFIPTGERNVAIVKKKECLLTIFLAFRFPQLPIIRSNLSGRTFCPAELGPRIAQVLLLLLPLEQISIDTHSVFFLGKHFGKIKK